MDDVRRRKEGQGLGKGDRGGTVGRKDARFANQAAQVDQDMREGGNDWEVWRNDLRGPGVGCRNGGGECLLDQKVDDLRTKRMKVFLEEMQNNKYFSEGSGIHDVSTGERRSRRCITATRDIAVGRWSKPRRRIR